MEFQANGDHVQLTKGIEAQLILTITKYMNLSHTVIDYKYNYGKKYENGSWSGLTGQLVTNVTG